jgi:signal transduction histidine kinase
LALLSIVAVGMLAAQFAHPVAYEAPTLRATFETIMTLFAVVTAWVLRGRFYRTWRVRDLLLFAAALMLALVELATYAAPAVFDSYAGGQAGAAAQWGGAFVATMFVAAAVCTKERLATPRRRPVLRATAATLTMLVAVEVAAALSHDQLLTSRTHGASAVLDIRFPLGWALSIATTALLSYAALRVSRQAHRSRDAVLAMFAGGLILLATSRPYSLALGWSSPRWTTPRDGIRLLAFALLLSATLRTELHARVRLMRAAVIAERRRIARDLHDGLAQDLAFLAGNVSRVGAPLRENDPVAVAARRALALSRDAIRDLSSSHSTSTRETLESIGHELQERFALEVALNVRLTAELPPETREDVARIMREAVVNAAKHGESEHVIVSLTQTDAGLTLRVADDGRGLADGNPLRPRHEGFGLRSIRERAAALGGRLTLRDRQGGGAELELVLPR